MAAACLCPSPLFPRSSAAQHLRAAKVGPVWGVSASPCLDRPSRRILPGWLVSVSFSEKLQPEGGARFPSRHCHVCPVYFLHLSLLSEMRWVIIRKLRWSRDFVSSVYPWCLERKSAPVRARGGSKATTCTDPGVWEAQAGAGQLPPEDAFRGTAILTLNPGRPPLQV